MQASNTIPAQSRGKGKARAIDQPQTTGSTSGLNTRKTESLELVTNPDRSTWFDSGSSSLAHHYTTSDAYFEQRNQTMTLVRKPELGSPSLASNSALDFSSPSSVTSAITTATISIHLGSSRDKAESVAPLQPIYSNPGEITEEQAQPRRQSLQEPVQQSNLPPLYLEETLPQYDQTPAYSPSLAGSDTAPTPSRTSAFKASATSRFFSSRLAQTLHISSRSKLLDDPTRTSVPNTPRTEHVASLRQPFARSDSAPELPRSRACPQRQSYAATDFMQGARMGPFPHHDQVRPRLQPSTSVNPPTRPDSSQRNVSRPTSRAGSYAESSGGLFHCGYSSNRSRAATPNRFGHAKNRVRNLSLRNLPDILLHRGEFERGLFHRQEQDSNGPSASLTPQVASLLPNARSSLNLLPAEEAVTCSGLSTSRPSLMRAAYSVPQALVVTETPGQSCIVSPTREREPNRFEQLPRELILLCFQALVDAHVLEHQRQVQTGFWRGSRSTSTQWVGVESAVRELARLSCISRSWQSYVLDGQLWKNVDMSPYPQVTEEALGRIARSAGPFIRKLDLHGLSNLSSGILTSMFSKQQIRLVKLSLEGCHSISMEDLHRLLSCSPNLAKVNLSNLRCVNDETCRILGTAATGLECLNVSRCPNLTANGIMSMAMAQDLVTNASAVQKERNLASVFKELRAAGLKGVDVKLMRLIGGQWPFLEHLDLSYALDLRDACVEAFVSSQGDLVSEKGLYIPLGPRQAGIDDDEQIYRRRFPQLRSINWTGCRHITDRAFTYLAHSVPQLEVLQLANLGAAIKDAGLVKLLPTIPHLQKLDLEGAGQITDSVITALTPPASHAEAYGAATPEQQRGSILRRTRRWQASELPGYDEAAVAALIPVTGTELTHLILSSATRLTVESLTLLIQRCPMLLHLELDDTHADNTIARSFVHLVKLRKLETAYLSLVDCRAVSRSVNQELFQLEDGGTRPRNGQRGYAFRHFNYDDESEGNDECNTSRAVLKTFWGWQNVDARMKAKRKALAKRNRLKGVGRMGRWSRMLSSVDDSDPESSCIIT